MISMERGKAREERLTDRNEDLDFLRFLDLENVSRTNQSNHWGNLEVAKAGINKDVTS